MSLLDFDNLRRAFRDRRTRAGLEEACPDRESIWSAARGEAPRQETVEIVKHTGRCAACADSWRLAAALGAGEPGEATRPGAVRRRWLPITAAAAAMLVVAVGLGVVLLQRPDDSATPFRSDPEQAIRSLVPEDRPLPRSEFLLRWSPGPEGTIYRVDLSIESGPLPSPPPLDEPQYLVPAESLAAVPAGGRVFWRVRASFPDGSEQASIGFFNVVQ